MSHYLDYYVLPKTGNEGLRSWIRVQACSEMDDQILISPNLMTEKEIDDQIDLLIEELKQIRKNAKASMRRRNAGK